MEVLRSWLSTIGISVSEIITDGKIHRFDYGEKKDKSGWYIAGTSLMPSGNYRYSMTVGDNRTGEKYVYKPNGEISHSDKKFHEEKIKEDSEKARIEKEKGWLEATVLAQKIWDGAKEAIDNVYEKRKGLSGPSLWVRQTADGTLLVPIQNSDGLLCGLQSINPDGSKRFTRGMRKEGGFFQFGEFGGEGGILIAEGYATGKSLYTATGLTTVVAFDAGNLAPVAVEIRKKYRDAHIILCADNDAFSETNIGLEKATAAAKEAGGNISVVVPTFKDLSTKPTDFNDLMVLEGLEEVKRQVPSLSEKDLALINEYEPMEPPPAIYFKCLGHDAENYYYMTSDNKHVKAMSPQAHSTSNLLDLMPLEYWGEKYLRVDKKGNPVGIDWTKAASDLMEECRQVGIFNGDKIRGAGCWMDSGKLVVHLGDRLLVDKTTIPIEGMKNSKFIYELGTTKEDLHNVPLSNEECLLLVDACSGLNWKGRDDAKLFLGWLVISRLCGALQWRPHVWLTGPSGSGKSTIIETIIKNITGSWGLQPVGGSTEAGIRQSIRRDSRPVFFDEAETNNEKSHRRIQSVLELIRQSSSLSDARIMKGTSNQKGMHFKINCMFLLSSIRVNLMEEADKNRFTVLELLRNDGANWGEISLKLETITEEYGERLFSRVAGCWGNVLANKEVLQEVISRVHGQRIGQQYGTLLAGYLALFTVGPVSMEAAEKVVMSLELANKSFIELDHDEAECLQHLMDTKIQVFDKDEKRSELSVGLLMDRARQEITAGVHHYRNQLKMLGIKIEDDMTGYYVANRNPELAKIFRGTEWDNRMWGKALLRVSGAVGRRARFGDKYSNQLHCTWIPFVTNCDTDSLF